jgi:myosin V
VISSTIASRLGLDSESGDIENQIIASNPITESFGNAKTSRNNNSSRFGKFIELGYSRDGIIENGSIRTYLLETVRVTAHVEGERGFHIFYELAAHSPDLVASKGVHSLCDFKYTNSTASSRNSITSDADRQIDAENYGILLTALHTMGVDPVDQEMMEDLVLAILHIGNLTFETSEVAGEDDAIFSAEAMASHVPFICELLGITAESLLHAIGRRSLTVGVSTTVKNLSVVDVMHATDNLTKTLYSALFGWVLECINESLNESPQPQGVVSTIGVLDIFGFEFFENNSLEQLCINYTNEKLQVRPALSSLSHTSHMTSLPPSPPSLSLPVCPLRTISTPPSSSQSSSSIRQKASSSSSMAIRTTLAGSSSWRTPRSASSLFVTRS